MSEKTSRKHFLFAAGTTVAGWLAFCGFRRADAAERTADAASEANKLPVEAKPEPRAVARPRL